MWSPIDMFYVIWICNFSPCKEARLNVKQVIDLQENKAIAESVTLRNEN